MTVDFTYATKHFLLNYPLFDSLFSTAQSELQRVYRALESRLGEEDWFSTAQFDTRIIQNRLLLWKRTWHPSVTTGFPWVHMECGLHLREIAFVARLDVDPDRVPVEVARETAERLASDLRDSNSPLLEAQGWHVVNQGRRQVTVLRKSEAATADALSAQWIVDRGVALLNELVEVGALVDQMVEAVAHAG